MGFGIVGGNANIHVSIGSHYICDMIICNGGFSFRNRDMCIDALDDIGKFYSHYLFATAKIDDEHFAISTRRDCNVIVSDT